MGIHLKKKILLIFILTSSVNAVNLLMLQGTETKEGHHPWGFSN